MSRAIGQGVGTTRKAEPLRGVERLEWARVTLEEAVGRMVKYPEDRAYFAAVCARYREMQNIRFPVEAHVAAVQREGEGPIQALVCPNCLKGVATVMQHYTGADWMCRDRELPPIGEPTFDRRHGVNG